ncbi:hypothetical protein BT69DRAFT_1276700 [Atractiella rhizophila]|nr:hypothetical protein BT69DRAFT_1276700 [Atractiella rhizophila]
MISLRPRLLPSISHHLRGRGRSLATVTNTTVRSEELQAKVEVASEASMKKVEEKKRSIAERDAELETALKDRDGGGLGNEIVDGEFEKGMTKFTRKNQFRVMG